MVPGARRRRRLRDAPRAPASPSTRTSATARTSSPGRCTASPPTCTTAQATSTAWPRMERGSDLILDRRLHRIGGPGRRLGRLVRRRRLPEVHPLHGVQRRAAVLQRPAARRPRAPSAARRGAATACTGSTKMWDAQHRHPATSRSGSARATGPGTFRGDHDLWRLPQADDRDTRPRRPLRLAPAGVPRRSRRATGSAPTWSAGSSAAFALAAQQDAGPRPGARARELRQARLLYARAATRHPPHPLVTALPHAFYPESSWRDDMQLGAAEIALAAHRLGRAGGALPRATARTGRAASSRPRRPTPSTSTTRRALADSVAGRRDGPRAARPARRSTPATWSTDLRRQIQRGRRHARHDPFGAAEPVSTSSTRTPTPSG